MLLFAEQEFFSYRHPGKVPGSNPPDRITYSFGVNFTEDRYETEFY